MSFDVPEINNNSELIQPDFNNVQERDNLVSKSSISARISHIIDSSNVLTGMKRIAQAISAIAKNTIGKLSSKQDNMQLSEEMAAHFGSTADEIREHLLNPRSTDASKALFIYSKSNELLGKMADHDEIVAQGGADLSKQVFTKLTKELLRKNSPEVKKELAKAFSLTEEQIGSSPEASSMVDDARKIMELDVANQREKLNSDDLSEEDRQKLERTVKFREEQMESYDMNDLAPNVRSRMDEFHKASGVKLPKPKNI